MPSISVGFPYSRGRVAKACRIEALNNVSGGRRLLQKLVSSTKTIQKLSNVT